MRFKQTESVLQTKNPSEPTKKYGFLYPCFLPKTKTIRPCASDVNTFYPEKNQGFNPLSFYPEKNQGFNPLSRL